MLKLIDLDSKSWCRKILMSKVNTSELKKIFIQIQKRNKKWDRQFQEKSVFSIYIYTNRWKVKAILDYD